MLIGTRKIKDEIVDQLVQSIKKKKELKNLTDLFVKETLKRYFSQNSKKITFLSQKFNTKSKDYKQIIKEVRSNLRRVHGLFRFERDSDKRKDFLEKLTKTKLNQKEFLELHKKILETHISTKERLSFYESLYKNIFKLIDFSKTISKPLTIIDLGCGINPFSIPFMKLKELNYHAYDLAYDEIDLLNKYFKFLSTINKGSFSKIKGKAAVFNLLQLKKINKLPKADICFLWKTTDVLDEGKGHKISEEVISYIPSKFVVVSFPIITTGGKQMNQPRRKWIELMCKRLGFSYKIIKETNEIFYIIEK